MLGREWRGPDGRSLSALVLSLLLATTLWSVAGCSCESLDTGTEDGDGVTSTTAPTESTEAAVSTTQTSTSAESTTSTTSPSIVATTTTLMQLQPIPITVSPQWNHIEENSDSIRYTGAWMGHVALGDDPSYRSVNQSGASAEVTFSGTRIRLLSVAAPEMGRAKLTLDSLSPVYIDLYGTEEESEIVWTSGTLTDGPHTLTIEWTGIKSAAATNTVINIEAIEVMGVFAM